MRTVKITIITPYEVIKRRYTTTYEMINYFLHQTTKIFSM